MSYRCLNCGSRFGEHRAVCSHCWSSHALTFEAERPRALVDEAIELTTAQELSKTKWSKVPIPAYPSLELSRGAMVVLMGPSGSGKSSMLARAIDSIKGPALILSSEEPAGPSVADRLARLDVKRADLIVCSRASVDQLVEVLRSKRIVAVGIDSVQRAAYEPRELRHLLNVLPNLSVLFAVSQVNANGDVRGGTELAHECDLLVEVGGDAGELSWRITKSRYQESGVGGSVLSTEPKRERSLHVVAP